MPLRLLLLVVFAAVDPLRAFSVAPPVKNNKQAVPREQMLPFRKVLGQAGK